MKKRKLQIRDLKFLKAARLRANTQAAVEKIDAEIAAYTARIPAHKLNPQAIQFAKLVIEVGKFLEHPSIVYVLREENKKQVGSK